MSDPFKPLLYLLAGVALGTLCLWLLIGQFLGSTNDMASDMASEMARRAALSGGQSGVVQPLTIDAQRKAELQRQLSDNATPLQKRDAADSAASAASVQSRVTPVVAERADSDDDIEVQRSIEQLEQALADEADPSGDAFIDSTSDTLSGESEEASLSAFTTPSKQGTVVAIDVSLDLDDQCQDRRADAVRVGVQFRSGSYAIKGRSLSELDLIVEAARQCDLSVVIVENLSPSVVDGDRDLAERRADEIKYYLLQRGIDKELMRFQDQS